MNPAELLAQVPLFEHLTPDDLERVAAATHVQTFEPDTDVVQIGDPGRSLYIVLEGKVQVLYPARSADFELARLGPGDFFGEMAILNDKPRSATVRTQGEVRTLALAKEDFCDLLLELPAAAVQILEVLSVRLRNTDEQISGLTDKAMRDALTGLLNRRAFHERLLEECDRTRRYNDDFSLILLDIDHFKSVNDTFGHDVGDAVLAWLGRLLQEHTRTADTPFRIGGEEFAVLCPRTPGDTTGTVARRVVAMVGEARPPLDFEIQITLSAGFSACPDHAPSPERLYQIANRALLRAKAEGRDRVCNPEEVPLPDVG